jgi:phage terminase large subunit
MISFSSEIKSIADLRSELCRIPRKRTGNGVFQVVSKDDMKNKLGMKSPNEADAVMMSLTDWQPKNVIDYSKFNIPSTGW